MTILFISDLHLSENQPALTQIFLNFLRCQARDAEALYILGDFFESWIGDDNQTPFNKRIAEALTDLKSHGVTTYFMPGNRDFLIGSRFLQTTGCQYLPDPSLISLYGTPTLLMHGDSLCRLDKNYLRFRAWTRRDFIQSLFLHLPLTLRKKIAHYLRNRPTPLTTEFKAQFDITMEALFRCLETYPRTELVIHGHTHQPAIQLLRNGNTLIKRIVLSDWNNKQGNVLIALSHQVHELVYFS